MPPLQKPVTEGGAFKALTKVHWETNPSATMGPSVRDEALQERTRDLLDYCSEYRDRSVKSTRTDVLEYRRTTDLSSTHMDWLNSELFALLAIKTSDTANGIHQVTGKKWKSRESFRGNAWNVKREDTIDIEWRFSLNR